MQSSNLNESWMLFSVSVREYCHAENQGQRDRAATDLKWHLGRIKSIVAGITPESLPKLAPVYLENLQQFVESWDAPELFQRGQHDGKDQMHLGLLELEEPIIRMAIRQVEEAAEPEKAGSPPAQQPHQVTEPNNSNHSRTWQEVLPELEDIMNGDQPWTSLAKMAEGLHTTVGVIRNAIKNGSAELEEWTKRQHGPSRKLASPEESEHGFRSLPQQREPDPSDAAESTDVEWVTQQLIAETTKRHGNEQGKRLQADIDAGKFDKTTLARMADAYLNDPDEDDQARKYKILADQSSRQGD